MSMPTHLIFKVENGETIKINRPTGYDIFQANGLADTGDGTFKSTLYYNQLLINCWDKGKDLSYLKNLNQEEGIRLNNLIIKFFDAKLGDEEIKKYNGQSITEQSQTDN